MTDHASSKRVEREDVALFISACFACTGQAEYYADRGDQAVSVAFLHAYIRVNYRRLYALCLAAGINDFSRAMVVFELLKAGAPGESAHRREEGELIAATLATLPPPRVFRLFRRLQAERVNNRRTRATVRRYLAQRRDAAFDALKYRPGMRAAARHTHTPLPGELGPFLFKRPHPLPRYATPLLETWRNAHFSKKALFELPMTVAEGLAAKHGLSRKQFLAGIEKKMTRRERERVEASARAAGAGLAAVDLTRMDLTRLVLYALSRPRDERDALRPTIDAAAERIARALPKLGDVAAVLDCSRSTRGAREKANRPLAVSLAIDAVLRRRAALEGAAYRADWTRSGDALLQGPRGQTELAQPLIEALRSSPDRVVIVSDGYENVGVGSAAEVVRVARARLGSTAPVVHVSPVFDADTYAPRPLGAPIVTVGVRVAGDLPVALRVAEFVHGAADADALNGWLSGRARALLDQVADR